jgi:hypothetical protein
MERTPSSASTSRTTPPPPLPPAPAIPGAWSPNRRRRGSRETAAASLSLRFPFPHKSGRIRFRAGRSAAFFSGKPFPFLYATTVVVGPLAFGLKTSWDFGSAVGPLAFGLMKLPWKALQTHPSQSGLASSA